MSITPDNSEELLKITNLKEHIRNHDKWYNPRDISDHNLNLTSLASSRWAYLEAMRVAGKEWSKLMLDYLNTIQNHSIKVNVLEKALKSAQDKYDVIYEELIKERAGNDYYANPDKWEEYQFSDGRIISFIKDEDQIKYEGMELMRLYTGGKKAKEITEERE